MKLSKTEHILLFITILSFIFCMFFIFTNRLPEIFLFWKEIMNFIFTISISIIASSIFYIFQIYIPQKHKRDIIKNNFSKQYKDFKLNCIWIFLSVSEWSYSIDKQESLYNLKAFKEFFKTPAWNNQNNWHKVMNWLNDNLLRELLIELEILKNEVSFILNNIDINDEDVFSFLKRLSQNICRFKSTTNEYWEIDQLLQFLWELFSGWSFIGWYRDEDIFEVIFKKI